MLSLLLGGMIFTPIAVYAQETEFTYGNDRPVEVYDFLVWAPEKTGNDYTYSLSTEAITTSSGNTMYMETATFNGYSLYNRFAFSSGFNYLQANQGLLYQGKRIPAAILGLKQGDMLSLTFGTAGTEEILSTNASYLDNDGIPVTTTSGTILTSDVVYTMTADGTFDFQQAHSKAVRYQKVVILKPIKLGVTGYATYTNVTSTTLALPDGLKAYIVQNGNSNFPSYDVTLERISNIPAGWPVILKGEPNTTYTLSATADVATTIASGKKNVLVAVKSDIELQPKASIFLLGVKDGKVGFFPTTGNGILYAGKAYLDYQTKYMPSTASEAKGLNIVFEDNETLGIYSTFSDERLTTNDVYDLSGRKISLRSQDNSSNTSNLSTRQLVNSLTKKGIYINNGKKIVIK